MSAGGAAGVDVAEAAAAAEAGAAAGGGAAGGAGVVEGGLGEVVQDVEGGAARPHAAAGGVGDHGVAADQRQQALVAAGVELGPVAAGLGIVRGGQHEPVDHGHAGSKSQNGRWGKGGGRSRLHSGEIVRNALRPRPREPPRCP